MPKTTAPHLENLRRIRAKGQGMAPVCASPATIAIFLTALFLRCNIDSAKWPHRTIRPQYPLYRSLGALFLHYRCFQEGNEYNQQLFFACIAAYQSIPFNLANCHLAHFNADSNTATISSLSCHEFLSLIISSNC